MDSQNLYNDYDQQNAPQPNKANGMSIASLIVAIVGILLGCCWGIVGVICGIVALVLGIMGNKKNKSGVGTAGIVVSIICIVLSIISAILGVIIMASLETVMQEMGYSYY